MAKDLGFMFKPKKRICRNFPISVENGGKHNHGKRGKSEQKFLCTTTIPTLLCGKKILVVFKRPGLSRMLTIILNSALHTPRLNVISITFRLPEKLHVHRSSLVQAIATRSNQEVPCSRFTANAYIQFKERTVDLDYQISPAKRKAEAASPCWFA